MRTVLDTGVIVAALRSDAGASRLLVASALRGKYPLLLSVPLVLEYEAVTTRAEHLEVAGLTSDEVGTILDMLVSVAKPVRFSFRWRPMLGDPGDDMVLETATNGAAQLLVTFNRRDFLPAERQFNIRIVSPAEALQHLELI